MIWQIYWWFMTPSLSPAPASHELEPRTYDAIETSDSPPISWENIKCIIAVPLAYNNIKCIGRLEIA